MSLRLKLALLLAAIAGVTLVAAWVVTGRTVLQPFTREVLETYLDEVVYVADRIERGAAPEELARALNLEVELRPHPPPFMLRPPRTLRGPRCESEPRGRFEVTHCRGRRAPVGVKLAHGYLLVRRDLDIGGPTQRIGRLLLVVALAVTGCSVLVAALITQPLDVVRGALQRIGEGDLAHRLPVTGGRELAELARTYNMMADRVDALLRTERELMAGISHELRTPLARLRLQLELLRDAGLAEKRLGAMEADLVEVDRLIGELLESSRLSLGERSLATTELSLAAVVAEAVEKTPLPAHRVRTELADAAVVRGDRARLVRAVGNLLQNAGKYAPEGTEVEVRVSGAVVEVRDAGPGVPESELPHLFEPFYRGARARAGNQGGLGLGLMIARQVAALHGGRVTATNRPEGGLAIALELEAARSGDG